ncbi:hypothetical protein [Spirochaeta cellobiosiphila]|uniref:hypothetical protein n=1 Tax=Spirochaeta cellobiosiphila TaxID=504483 RepID=UPI00040B36A8|nr:hypothetical protein [Spirochaeta cellobiosiphila]
MKFIISLILVSTCFSCTSFSPHVVSQDDKKHMNSVDNYLRIVDFNLGEWDSLKKAEDNLSYAKEVYAKISPIGLRTPRAVSLAAGIEDREKLIQDKKSSPPE